MQLTPVIRYPKGANASDAWATLKTEVRGNALIFSLELTNRPDNRLLPKFVDIINLALDEVERTWRADLVGELEGGPGNGAAALVTMGPVDAHRFFSNGLDLDAVKDLPGWLTEHFQGLLLRLLVFPIVTVAAINGHAFAGGAVIALAQDFRVLKNAEGKGGQAMICMNEVHFGAPIPPGMGALARGKTSPQTAHKLLIVGHRFRGPEALKAGLVDVLEPTGDKTVERALQMAEASAGLSANAAVGRIKEELYKHLIPDLKEPMTFGLALKRDPKADARLAARAKL